MQRKRLNLGYSDFKEVIASNHYFVDKSLLIQEVLESEHNVLLLPRPRRFGKTMNLSMLRCFFDKNEPENETLFHHLKIWQAPQSIKAHQGAYPVLYLTFKDAKEVQWNDCYELIVAEIAAAYEKHNYLLTANILSEKEKDLFTHIIAETASRTQYQRSLKNLTEYLHRYHGKKAVILIDEYDTPIQAGYDSFYDEVIAFMRNLLSGAFKDNSSLFKGIITGILRVSRESLFSGLNNISVHSILQDEFSDKFGFTETEVRQLLEDFAVKVPYSTIKTWYNGYCFGNTCNIYNPWSLLNFVVSSQKTFYPYWVNTSSDALIKSEIRRKNAETIRQGVMALISDQPLTKPIEENFVFSDLTGRKELLWTLLIFSGYLTVKKQVARKDFELVIPNYELKTVFQDTILEWLEADVLVAKSQLHETIRSLTENELAGFEQGFRKITGDTFSYYDTAQNPEYVYQAYMLGVLAVAGDDYLIRSNRESGEGRYDIMLIPHDKSRNGLIIEMKQIQAKTAEESQRQFAQRLNKTLEKARKQITQNRYYQELLQHQLKPEQIIQVPIVFAGKIPYVQKLNS